MHKLILTTLTSLTLVGCGLPEGAGRSPLANPEDLQSLAPEGGPNYPRLDPPQPLTADEEAIKDFALSQQEQMQAQLKALVELCTAEGEQEDQEEALQLLANELSELDFATALVDGAPADLGPWGAAPDCRHLLATRTHPNADRRILLLGHVDTVHHRESGFLHYHQNEMRAFGPGVLDMKGGLVIMLHALRALREAGALDRANWTVFINTDEETGSLTSRPILERLAQQSDVALVFEGSHTYDLTVSRGGLGRCLLRVHGRAAHVSDMQDGADAIYELAQKIIKLKELTDIERGNTINIAPVHGGTAANVVADTAWCELDLRFRHMLYGVRLMKQVRRIAQHAYVRAPGRDGTPTRSDFWGVLHRPPMPRTQQNRQLAEYFRTTGRDLDCTTRLVHSSGGSDANIVAAMGCPTIDGLGPVGTGEHTAEEYIMLDSLPIRTAGAAIGLVRLLGEEHPLLVRAADRAATGE